jgi:hypothetical protein
MNLAVTVPKLNEPLIAKALKHIEAFPKSYDQNDVARTCDVTKKTPCGAIGCLGGWIVLLSKPASKRQDLANTVQLSEARELAGLTQAEADYLFETAEGNPKKDLRTIKKRLANVRKAREIAKKFTVPRGIIFQRDEITVEVDNCEFVYDLD